MHPNRPHFSRVVYAGLQKENHLKFVYSFSTHNVITSPRTQLMPDDDPWFSPLLKTAEVVPREPESLWEVFSADQHTWSARLLDHGDWGVEAQLFGDSEFVMGWRFNTKAEAVAWALMERADHEKAGNN